MLQVIITGYKWISYRESEKNVIKQINYKYFTFI